MIVSFRRLGYSLVEQRCVYRRKSMHAAIMHDVTIPVPSPGMTRGKEDILDNLVLWLERMIPSFMDGLEGLLLRKVFLGSRKISHVFFRRSLK